MNLHICICIGYPHPNRKATKTNNIRGKSVASLYLKQDISSHQDHFLNTLTIGEAFSVAVEKCLHRQPINHSITLLKSYTSLRKILFTHNSERNGRQKFYTSYGQWYGAGYRKGLSATQHACAPILTVQPPSGQKTVNSMGWISGAAWTLSSRDWGVTISWNWCCGLLPMSVKLLSVHAINTTLHRPSRISRLSVTFEILLASFRLVSPLLQYNTHLHFSQRDLCQEHVSRKVRISKMLLYIRFRTHKRLLQSASVY
jgi:hypothetical protein